MDLPKALLTEDPDTFQVSLVSSITALVNFNGSSNYQDEDYLDYNYLTNFTANLTKVFLTNITSEFTYQDNLTLQSPVSRFALPVRFASLLVRFVRGPITTQS